MTPGARMAHDDAITLALRAANDAIGDEEPTEREFRIIAAIKALRSDQPVRVTSTDRVDYLERVQVEARTAWQANHGHDAAARIGPEHDAVAGIDTPIGRLKCVTWRARWTGTRGERIAWQSEYYLGDEPITLAEIKAAGLAQRPTTRNRQRKEPAR